VPLDVWALTSEATSQNASTGLTSPWTTSILLRASDRAFGSIGLARIVVKVGIETGLDPSAMLEHRWRTVPRMKTSITIAYLIAVVLSVVAIVDLIIRPLHYERTLAVALILAVAAVLYARNRSTRRS
jgi:hypothetical protein